MKKIQGFSLLEMIGVMAVMAILAGALAPSVFQLIEEGYQTAEEQSLAAIAESLQKAIVRDKRIPTTVLADWSDAVSQYASLPPARITTNDKNFTRRLYADPMFFTASNQNFPGYTQTSGLASVPFSPRLMVVSNLAGGVTANLNTHDRFADVWEQNAGALLVEDDVLMIERINLAPLFVRVLLNNANTAQAGFALESGAENAVSAASGGVDGARTVYVLRGTQIGLTSAPFPGGATQRRLIAQQDLSLRYQMVGASWTWEG
ncbi:MAG: prepilin-type N-terminal cleavage/methylation domain-containing protein [Pseudomonadaceae bacterium]|nr:prepilin-type N-terminal cleavage/methylation domain-containing protein [Pseudomonadaceae bacterium]